MSPVPVPDGSQTVGDVLISIVRTAVPSAVGTVLAWLASRGLDLTAYGNAVNIYLVPATIGAYYTLVRLAEQRWPAAGVLLGWRARPKYAAPVADGP